MKKEYKLILFLLIIAVAILILKRPIVHLLSNIIVDRLQCDLIAGLISRIILLILLIFTLVKLDLYRSVDFFRLKIYNLNATFIPLLVIILAIVSNLQVYHNAPFNILFIFFLSVITIGLVEEILFRGIFFPLLVKANFNRKYSINIAFFVSSALFGIMHYINYIKTPKFDVVTSQVIFAFCIGCFFCGLLLRTKNIFLVAIIHGLVNFSFGSEVLKSIDPITKAQTQPTFISLFFTLFIWSMLFIAGYKMMKLAKKDTKPDTYNNISI